MAIVVLLLWLFTAGAGFYLLVTSNLGRARPAASAAPGGAQTSTPAGSLTSAPGGLLTSTPAEASTPASVGQSLPRPVRQAQAPAASEATTPATLSALVTQRASASVSPHAAMSPSASVAASAGPSRRERRADPYAPASLVASREAPIVPDLRSLAEFAHPACGIIGLGFWLGFTLVHARVLAWIAFGVIVATACIGLAWFTANTRAARRQADGQPPRFTGRLILVHGGAAAVTVTLAALTALLALR